MKRKRATQEEIIKALKEAESAGVSLHLAALGITKAACYRWRQKYGR